MSSEHPKPLGLTWWRTADDYDREDRMTAGESMTDRIVDVASWDTIDPATARTLIREHHIVDLVAIPKCGAAINFELGNGGVLSYWEAGEYGPETWWLWRRAT